MTCDLNRTLSGSAGRLEPASGQVEPTRDANVANSAWSAADIERAPSPSEAPPRPLGRRSDWPAPDVHGFHHARTGSVQYLVACPTTGCAAIIDPVLDFDEASGNVATHSADAILAKATELGLTIEWILDTHPHADHLSASHYLHARTGAKTGTGARTLGVQRLWKDIYGLGDEACDPSHWDALFENGDILTLGEVGGRVLFSPGHTMASITFVFADAAFVHDTMFMPVSGTARADFPGGDAGSLYDSIRAILALPDTTRLFTGHDYPPHGQAPQWESTVAAQRATNIHLAGDATRDAFIAKRLARDASLPMPRLILPALQVNLRGGRLPEPDGAGRRHLRIPLGMFPDSPWA